MNSFRTDVSNTGPTLNYSITFDTDSETNYLKMQELARSFVDFGEDEINIGDRCLYGSPRTGTLVLVEIVAFSPEPESYPEFKVLEVLNDKSGNNFFHFLKEQGKTMCGSHKYLYKLR